MVGYPFVDIYRELYPFEVRVDDMDPTLGASLHSVSDSLTTEYLSNSLSAEIDICCICLFRLAMASIIIKSVDEFDVEVE